MIEADLGYETRLTVAGVVGRDVEFDRFRDHPRVPLLGAVADLDPLYDSHRVFVAPTRYAAELPHKIHEAASFGIPVVAPELLRAQLGWRDRRDLLVADADDSAAFAQHVLTLYRSEGVWRGVRAGAAERIRVECGRDAYEDASAAVL